MAAPHPTVWTIGHSNMALADFLSILNLHQIEALVDVRRFPGSRKHPHFSREALVGSLPEAGIEYHWLPDLGGRRRPNPDSRNTAWINSSFRGYADYMETQAFHVGIEQLLGIASDKRTAIMCSEAVWWRCHRGLISDYLKSIDVEVLHIASGKAAELHPYTSAARIVDGRLSYAYPKDQAGLSVGR